MYYVLESRRTVAREATSYAGGIKLRLMYDQVVILKSCCTDYGIPTLSW